MAMADTLISIENWRCFGQRALMRVNQAFVLLLFVEGSGPVNHRPRPLRRQWRTGPDPSTNNMSITRQRPS